MNNYNELDTAGNRVYGRLADNIIMQFVGPAIGLRKTMPTGSAHLVSNLSIGLLSYLNHATKIDNYKITGSTIAFSGDVGLDFEIGAGFYFGISMGITLGVMQSLVIEGNGSVENLDLMGLQYSDASRFDLGFGLRYFL